MEIRPATSSDYESIAAIDHIALTEANRREFIRQSIEQGNAYVAILSASVAGYAVLEYSFYGNGFISLLYVDPEYRREGIGESLTRHLEGICQTPKLFTSTNQSNSEMQLLLTKLGFEPSGMIENLDEEDPELVYFKWLGNKSC